MKKMPLPGFLATFLIIITSLFVLNVILDYWRTLSDARVTASNILSQSSHTVQSELRRITYGSRQLMDLMDRNNREGVLDFLNPRSINRITAPFLSNDPFITSVNYGNDRGDGYLILQSDNGFRNRIKRSDTPGKVTWFELDSSAVQTARFESTDDYDPRQRPWYLAATRQQGVAWGEPYILRTTRDLGITASTTLSPRPGRGTGEIIGIDIKLKDLSRLLSDICRGEQTSIDLVDEQGFLLASSRFGALEKRLASSSATPPRLTDPGYALQKKILEYKRNSNRDQFEITHDNTRYFVKITPFPRGNGAAFLTILTLPKEALMAGFLSSFYYSLLLYLLFLGILATYFLARFIGPLRRLTRHAQGFSLENIPAPLPIDRHDEIGSLTASINGMIDTVRDRTAALRLSEEHYRTLVQNAMSIILRWDTSGTITFINEHGARLFGYRAEELTGRNVIGTIVAPTDSAGRDLTAMIENICAHPDSFRSNQNENRTKDGRTLWINWSNVSIRDGEGNPVEILSVGNDATAQVEAEREIRVLNEELEQRVAERTTAFEASNRELEAFCYSVSHDLRAPLRHINAFASILMEEHASSLEPQAADTLKRICRSARQMGTLIDDLLELSRVTRQELVPGPVDLSALAREIAEELERSDEGRRVSFSIADNVMAQGDGTLLRIVLMNLLGNAWKYTARTGNPAICFGAEPPRYNGLVFFVRDNGAGFDMQFADKLFKPFQRLHRVDEFEGTGIGLAIVERIIMRHGGSVWAESRPGEGATFFFSIPFSGKGA